MNPFGQDDEARDSRSAHWVGWRHSGPLAALLAQRLGEGRTGGRWRFHLKLLTAPHLAVADVAIVGLVPASHPARWVCSILTLVAACTRPASDSVLTEHLPIGLRWLPRDWRVVNLAASSASRRPGAALALGRLIIDIADAHGAILRVAARTDDSRLIPAYIAHGFVVASVPSSGQIVEVVRARHTSHSATRRHYESYPFVEGGDRRVAHWVRRLSPLLSDDLLARRRVLDLGCGSGEASLGLLARGARPISMDLTRAAVQRLRGREPSLPVCQGDALALPFGSATFDHIISIGVLHHTPDWRRALAEAARVLRPDGRLVIMMYASGTPYHLLWTCAAPLRSHIPVESLERLPRWFLTAMRLAVAAQVGQRLADVQLRGLLADQLWTPITTFVSSHELDRQAAAEGLLPVRRRPLFWHAHLVAYQRRKG
jgi:SAM-dependent methyltransferase